MENKHIVIIKTAGTMYHSTAASDQTTTSHLHRVCDDAYNFVPSPLNKSTLIIGDKKPPSNKIRITNTRPNPT